MFNLNLQSQSQVSFFNGIWQKRPRELDHRLGFEIEEMAPKMHHAVPVANFAPLSPLPCRATRSWDVKRTMKVSPRYTSKIQMNIWWSLLDSFSHFLFG